jgi:hypothetical protein
MRNRSFVTAFLLALTAGAAVADIDWRIVSGAGSVSLRLPPLSTAVLDGDVLCIAGHTRVDPKTSMVGRARVSTRSPPIPVSVRWSLPG